MTSKPAVQPRPAIVVWHPAFQEARTQILTAVGAGPATVALLGAAGTGKTWLLRELASDLSEQGCQVTLLRQGDLPWKLSPGTALLVDEASRMDGPQLQVLAGQTSGLVILADLPSFAETLQGLSPPPPPIGLPLLDREQIRSFVADWIESASERGVALTEDAVQRVVVHSSGTPRLITRLLSAAVAHAALSGPAPIDGAIIDQIAELRLGGIAPEPPPAAVLTPATRVPEREPAMLAPSPPSGPAPEYVQAEQAVLMGLEILHRRAKPAWTRLAALAGSALAVAIVLGWLLERPGQEVAREEAELPSQSVAAITALAQQLVRIPQAQLSSQRPDVPSPSIATASPATAAAEAPVALADLTAPPPTPVVPAAPVVPPRAVAAETPMVLAEPAGSPPPVTPSRAAAAEASIAPAIPAGSAPQAAGTADAPAPTAAAAPIALAGPAGLPPQSASVPEAPPRAAATEASIALARPAGSPPQVTVAETPPRAAAAEAPIAPAEPAGAPPQAAHVAPPSSDRVDLAQSPPQPAVPAAPAAVSAPPRIAATEAPIALTEVPPSQPLAASAQLATAHPRIAVTDVPITLAETAAPVSQALVTPASQETAPARIAADTPITLADTAGPPSQALIPPAPAATAPPRTPAADTPVTLADTAGPSSRALVPSVPPVGAPGWAAAALPIALADRAASPPRAPVPAAPAATVPAWIAATDVPMTIADISGLPPQPLDAAPGTEPAPPPSAAGRSQAPRSLALMQPPAPLVAAEPEPARQATPRLQPLDGVAAEPTKRAGQGGPGLILVARPGDTLHALYANIYQGLRPPPYDEVVAANPRPFRPGAVVVFPEPPGGWRR